MLKDTKNIISITEEDKAYKPAYLIIITIILIIIVILLLLFFNLPLYEFFQQS